jgi:hypothetical protein
LHQIAENVNESGADVDVGRGARSKGANFNVWIVGLRSSSVGRNGMVVVRVPETPVAVVVRGAATVEHETQPEQKHAQSRVSHLTKALRRDGFQTNMDY